MSGKGRPIGWRKDFSEMRPRRQLRAFDDEFEVIKNFMQLVREIGAEKAQNFIEQYKQNQL